MSDIMRPVPFQELLERMFSEYRNHGSIFGIQKENFFRTDGRHSIEVFGQKCSTPLGPAAGPHTQLAQNIVSAYLTGGRFIELKTVQIMDYLGTKKMIAKPCIDASDEGHNVEWSTEYTLEKAFDEYLKAWFALHALQTALTGKVQEPDFIFNMSVGYSLDGIKQPKMQTFINSMMNASLSPLFSEYQAQLRDLTEDGWLLDGTDLENSKKALKGLEERISPEVVKQATISTMHGCPPTEIEAICRYMLEEKHLNVFVKLNPTLLGYDRVRSILDETGFEHVILRRETFEHDLQYSDAKEMLHRLFDTAKTKGLGFGVKLTNTLGNVNDGSVLPGEEKYMSGRALLPISTGVAALISREFDGKIPVSYSGGATAFSVKDIFDTGIRPITLATDMLKPGGYARMTRMAEILEKESTEWNRKDIDPAAVEKLSENAVKAPYSKRSFRGDSKAKTSDALPVFNCYVSPCMEACPVHQPIPDYVSLVSEGKYSQALELIYSTNALPNMTCSICDHQCQYHCARMDYEGSVNIRDMKKIAVQKGMKDYLASLGEPEEPSDIKAVVVGAGPAGLSAAYFLAVSGFDTTIMEKGSVAGGVPANVIPSFRIAPETVQADVDVIKAMGVKFVMNAPLSSVTLSSLRSAGYDYIFYATGCAKDNTVKLSPSEGKIIGAQEFLESFKAGKAVLGPHVVVTGGGNTAMDSARAAIRTAGVSDVTVVYRRSLKEMPADMEEYESAVADGIKFMFLANPSGLSDCKLSVSKMALGEPDASGRRRPVETGEKIEIPCSVLLTAIGEHADSEELGKIGLAVSEKGWPVVNSETGETAEKHVYAIGDMASGPSTIVRCIASARRAVDSAIDSVYAELESSEEDSQEDECCCNEHGDGCCCHEEGCHCHDEEDCDCDCDEDDYDEEQLDMEEEAFYRDIQHRKTNIFRDKCTEKDGLENYAKREGQRCMDCTYLCNKCVDVCPNRANVAIDMRFSEFSDDPFQIIHIDAFCNECGNCATFCNHCGKPYRDKFTLFSRRDDFDNSENNGFYAEGDSVTVRLFGKITECRMDGEGKLQGDIPDLARDIIEQVFLSYDYLLTRVDE